MFIMDWKLGIIATITSIIAILIGQKMNKVSLKEAEVRQEQSEHLTEAVLSFVEGISVIKSYNLLGNKSKELSENFRQSRDKNIQFEEMVTPWMRGLSWLYAIGILGILISGLFLFISDTLSLTYTMGMLLFVIEIFNPLKSLYAESNNMTIVESCLDRIEELFAVEELPDKGKKEINTYESEYVVEYKNVCFSYGKKEVLHDVSFGLKENSMTALVGKSGSGKSTLLKCMSGLLQPSQGKVEIQGLDPYQTSPNKLAKLRRESLAFIFQSYNLVPALPIIENIALPLRLSGKKVNNQEILELLEKLQFKADSKAFPSTLSGGEQQKIAIARAILADSQIIFADEPTGALDSTSRQIVFDILRTLANQGKCILMVTHDIELASKTDRALILKDGLISQEIIKPKSEELTKALGIETDVRER